MNQSSHSKILGFDGIRGLSVISVVLSHLHFFYYLEHDYNIPNRVVTLFMGYTGVQAFFVLSGFLITMLLIKEHEKHGRISLRSFYMRRILRILPIYVIFLGLITLFHSLHWTNTSGKSLAFAYAYLYNFIPNAWYAKLMGHTWSLAVEEHFYLFWPFLFGLFFKNYRRALTIAIPIIFLASMAGKYLIFQYTDLEESFYVDRWTFFAGADILVGCFWALLLTGQNKSEHWLSLIKSKLFLFVGILIFAHSVFFDEVPFKMMIHLRSAGMGIMIAWVYGNQGSRIIKLLEFRPLRYIGVISYGIYLYQGFYLSTGPARSPGMLWPPSPLVGFILLCITAPLSFHFIEKPLLNLKKKYQR